MTNEFLNCNKITLTVCSYYNKPRGKPSEKPYQGEALIISICCKKA